MRWPTFGFLAICFVGIIKSEAERPKRDLATLLNIKKSIISSIFGGDWTDSPPEKKISEQFKLYKIPGHDGILVKAIPIVRHPEKVIEVTPVVATNPTLALLQSYLGTRTSEETLTTLERMKTLLSSGLLTDSVVLEKQLISRPPNTVYAGPTPTNIVSSIYPTIFHAPFEFTSNRFNINENIVKDSDISYIIPSIPGSPRVAYGHPMPGSVVISEGRPFKFPEPPRPPLPYLPPGIRVPEVFAPVPSVIFDVPKVDLHEFRPAKVPTTVEIPSSHYAYHQMHNDGSMTTTLTTDVGQTMHMPAKFVPVKNLPGVFLPEVPGPVEVQEILEVEHPGGYAYHNFQDDDSESTIINGGIINPTSLTYFNKEQPEAISVKPIVVERIKENSEISNITSANKNTPEDFLSVSTLEQTQEFSKQPSSAGFTYHQVEDDGSVTTFINGEAQHPVPLNYDSKEKPPNLSRLIQKSNGRGGYYYERLNDDGSIMTFSDSDGREPLSLNYDDTPEIQSSKGNGGYLYKRLNEDGTITTFFDSDAREPSRLNYNDILKPTGTGVPNSKDDGGYFYKRLNEDGSITTFSDSDGGESTFLNYNEKLKPTGTGVHNILQDRIGQIAETIGKVPVPEVPKLSTLSHVETSAINEENLSKYLSNGRYFYQQVNSDGSVTKYGGGAKFPFPIVNNCNTSKFTARPPCVILPPPRPAEVEPPGPLPHPIFLEGQDWYTPLTGSAPVLPLTDISKVWLPKDRPVDVHKILSTPNNNRFSYQQINSGGTTIYTNPGYQQYVPVKTSVPVVPGPPAATYGIPFSGSTVSVETEPVFRPTQVVSPAPNDYIYRQVKNDGSKTDDVASETSTGFHLNSAPGSSHLPPPRITFATPVVTSYMYKQMGDKNSNFTVVNVDHGFSNDEEPISLSQAKIPTDDSDGTLSLDKRVNKSMKAANTMSHSAGDDKVNIVVQAETNIHTASGSFQYEQNNGIPSVNSINVPDDVMKIPSAPSDNSEGTLSSNPIVVLSPEDKGANNEVHRGDI